MILGSFFAFPPLRQLRKDEGHILKIDGLWGLSFGNGVRDQPTDVLFFAAGPDDESHGLYGFIMPVAGKEAEEIE